jgi:hypothetical protein
VKLLQPREGDPLSGREAKELRDLLVKENNAEEALSPKLLRLYGEAVVKVTGQLLEIRQLVLEDYLGKVNLESQLERREKQQKEEQKEVLREALGGAERVELLVKSEVAGLRQG